MTDYTVALPYTESLWPVVKMQYREGAGYWKHRQRTQPIDAVLMHATRGAQGHPDDIEIGAFRNWEQSTGNFNPGAPSAGVAPYAGMSHAGVGPGVIIEVVDCDQAIPAWSSWPSDEHAYSIEVAQSNLGQAIWPATIASAVSLVSKVCARYAVPTTRIARVNDDWNWKGIAGHEDTVQGRAQGKSDPGEAFWLPFTAALTKGVFTVQESELLQVLADILCRNGMTVYRNQYTEKAIPWAKYDQGTAGAPGGKNADGTYNLVGEDCITYSKIMGYSFAKGLFTALTAPKGAVDVDQVARAVIDRLEIGLKGNK